MLFRSVSQSRYDERWKDRIADLAIWDDPKEEWGGVNLDQFLVAAIGVKAVAGGLLRRHENQSTRAL